MTRLLHPVTEAHEMLGISRATLYELIAEKKIAPVKIGRRTLFSHAELERYAHDLVRGADAHA